MQGMTTVPRARRRRLIAVAAASVLALAGSTLVLPQSDAAAKYPYKAPPSVAVANVGKDYAEIVFGTITGAPNYQIKAEALDSKGKVVAGKTKTTVTGPEGFWKIGGLSPSTKYKFTVAVAQRSPKKLLSKYSTKSATATTNPAGYLDAPVELQTRDDPTTELDKNGQRPYSIDLQWTAPAGFDPDKHQFQIEYATDRVMKAKKGSYKTAGTLVPPLLPTALMTADEPLLETTAPEPTAPDATPPAPSETPGSPAETPGTSTETPTAPAPEDSPASTVPPVTPEAPSPDAESSPTPQESTSDAAETPQPADTEQVAARAGGSADVVLLSTPIRPAAASLRPETYWAQVPSLASNTNWYMRVRIINKSTGSVVSERSDAVMVKTLSPKGYITGTVNLQGQPASSYVVAAYRDNDLHDQVDVRPDGSFQLSVRPGTYYRVAAVYIGPDNLSSRWFSVDPTRGVTRFDAPGRVDVKVGVATTGVDITPQSTPSYTVSGDIDCPGAAASQCTVDVAAMSTTGTSRVVKTIRSNNAGTYTLKGLPPGTYNLRISHADERYKVLTIKSVTISGADRTKVDGKLAPREWVKSYPAKIKRTGSTVAVSSKAWIASELPVVRAVQKCQWQRNGVNIAGATSCTYRLTAADRGKQIRVRIKQDRYGFVDNTTFSKAIRG